MIMSRLITLLLLVAVLAQATVRLYLKDGTHHTVSEYQVLKDRVRYYSTERGDWEEIPLELVDLKKTASEQKEVQESTKAEVLAEREETKAEADFRKEVASIPEGPGVYWITPNGMQPLKTVEQKIANSKKRQVLKVLSPIPMISGKSTVEVDGESSAFSIADAKPEFYFRMAREEHLAIYKLKPLKGVRIVETIQIIPVSNEVVEQPVEVETFKRQVGENLFRIWPTKPLDPGEYAVVEFTPPDDKSLNLVVYDFTIKAGK